MCANTSVRLACIRLECPPLSRPERILLSTSRSLGPGHSWGIAARAWSAEGHRIVAASETSLAAASEISPTEVVISVPGNIRGLSTSSLSVSSDALGEYERYRQSSDFSKTHATLLLMMSRVDSTGSFRGLEREVLARRVNLEVIQILLRARPTVAIFDVTPHEAFEFALLKVLEWLSIPTLMFQPSLVGPQVIARTGISKNLEVPFPSRGLSQHAAAQEAVVKISLAALARLRAGTGTVKMDVQRAKEGSSSTVGARFRAVLAALRRLGKAGQDSEFSLTGHHIRPTILRRALEVYLERSLRSSLTSSVRKLMPLKTPPKNRYALMALHYEPERSSIPEGSPFDSQLDAVIAARDFLPSEVELVVKEHFSQQAAALRGFVGRSPDFYDLVSSLPGVRLVGVHSDTRLLMTQAECVITLTGKVGIEAVGEGTPVLALGQPWWLGMPGTLPIAEASNYQSFLDACVTNRDALDAWLRHMVENVLLPGVASVPPDRYSSRTANLPVGFELLEAEGLIGAFRSLVGAP